MYVSDKPKTVTRKHTFYLTDHIEEFDHSFLERLNEVGPSDRVDIIINGPGGRCDIGFGIVRAIKECKGTVRCIVEYPSFSMSSIIALSGQELVILPNAYLMFHDYSTGSYGKGEEVYQQNENYRKFFKNAFKDVCKPFLSERECNEMFTGRDIYIHSDDEILDVRMKRHFK